MNSQRHHSSQSQFMSFSTQRCRGLIMAILHYFENIKLMHYNDKFIVHWRFRDITYKECLTRTVVKSKEGRRQKKKPKNPQKFLGLSNICGHTKSTNYIYVCVCVAWWRSESLNFQCSSMNKPKTNFHKICLRVCDTLS